MAELTVLRERLDTLARTGRIQRHPSGGHDDDVAEALARAVPSARIVRSKVRSRDVVELEVADDDRVTHVETKWRGHQRVPFRGETLARLTPTLPTGSSLLVVTNADDVSGARDAYSSALNGRIRIVSWTYRSDDDTLRQALTELHAD